MSYYHYAPWRKAIVTLILQKRNENIGLNLGEIILLRHGGVGILTQPFATPEWVMISQSDSCIFSEIMNAMSTVQNSEES